MVSRDCKDGGRPKLTLFWMNADLVTLLVGQKPILLHFLVARSPRGDKLGPSFVFEAVDVLSLSIF